MKQYIVDAFTDKLFGGNPAAVCVADSFPDDKLMQDIASENNLSETAFAVREDGGYRLRLGALHDSPLLVQETRQGLYNSISSIIAYRRT